eukprot:GHVU01149343.1.p1 GENE.GHVU01149343.1~~GHVU01149343.1.p1  ORF type:complete len:270 (-),score=-6.77 GHVU01149343.1:556-1365(-)
MAPSPKNLALHRCANTLGGIAPPVNCRRSTRCTQFSDVCELVVALLSSIGGSLAPLSSRSGSSVGGSAGVSVGVTRSLSPSKVPPGPLAVVVGAETSPLLNSPLPSPLPDSSEGVNGSWLSPPCCGLIAGLLFGCGRRLPRRWLPDGTWLGLPLGSYVLLGIFLATTLSSRGDLLNWIVGLLRVGDTPHARSSSSDSTRPLWSSAPRAGDGVLSSPDCGYDPLRAGGFPAGLRCAPGIGVTASRDADVASCRPAPGLLQYPSKMAACSP